MIEYLDWKVYHDLTEEVLSDIYDKNRRDINKTKKYLVNYIENDTNPVIKFYLDNYYKQVILVNIIHWWKSHSIYKALKGTDYEKYYREIFYIFYHCGVYNYSSVEDFDYSTIVRLLSGMLNCLIGLKHILIDGDKIEFTETIFSLSSYTRDSEGGFYEINVDNEHVDRFNKMNSVLPEYIFNDRQYMGSFYDEEVANTPCIKLRMYYSDDYYKRLFLNNMFYREYYTFIIRLLGLPDDDISKSPELQTNF